MVLTAVSIYRCMYVCTAPMPTLQEKKKVDWGDIEAKAKREAMWLLEFRKQQVRGILLFFPFLSDCCGCSTGI